MSDDIKRGWGEAGETWAKYVQGGNDYYRYYMTLPAFISFVGDVKGLRVLDMGCGEGYVARMLVITGAHVTGIDVNPTMIVEARKAESSEPLGVDYIESDARSMPMLRDATFDAAISYQAFMDIEDYQLALS